MKTLRRLLGLKPKAKQKNKRPLSKDIRFEKIENEESPYIIVGDDEPPHDLEELRRLDMIYLEEERALSEAQVINEDDILDFDQINVFKKPERILTPEEEEQERIKAQAIKEYDEMIARHKAQKKDKRRPLNDNGVYHRDERYYRKRGMNEHNRAEMERILGKSTAELNREAEAEEQRRVAELDRLEREAYEEYLERRKREEEAEAERRRQEEEDAENETAYWLYYN